MKVALFLKLYNFRFGQNFIWPKFEEFHTKHAKGVYLHIHMHKQEHEQCIWTTHAMIMMHD